MNSGWWPKESLTQTAKWVSSAGFQGSMRGSELRAQSRTRSFWEKIAEVLCASNQDAAWMSPCGGTLAGPMLRRSTRLTGIYWMDYHVYPIWPGNALGFPQDELEYMARERVCGLLCLAWISGWRLDGWRRGTLEKFATLSVKVILEGALINVIHPLAALASVFYTGSIRHFAPLA